ncbi:MAG TPA: lipid-binding SYLF domain-containing protein [Opitutaceae bacterium]
MKKLLTFLLATFCVAAAAHAEKALSRADYVKRFESCEAILREFQADPAYAVPADVLAKARGLVIMNQFKAGFIVGVQDGYAVLLVKKADGKWSVPALLRAGEASFGLQAGGKAVETVLVLMDDQTPRLLFEGRFKVGADAKAVAGPRAAERESMAQTALEAAPILVYQKVKGLYAGATLKTGWLQRNDTANRAFYSTNYTLPELLYSDWVTPPAEVQPLIDFVQKIAP